MYIKTVRLPAPYVRATSISRVGESCLDPDPQPYAPPPNQQVAPTNKRRRNRGGHRFDDMAMEVVSGARVDLFVRFNRLKTDSWVAPPLFVQLDEIYERMQVFQTTANRPFRDLLAERGLQLAVCIVQDFHGTPKSVAFNTGSIFNFPIAGGAYGCRIPHVSSRTNISRAGLLFSADRRRIVQKKFSLPNGGCVIGPYLAVIAFEPVTGLVVRARLIPVEVSANQCMMNPVRSRFERGMHFALYGLGALSYSTLRGSELADLQRGLGHRWIGDLSSYLFNPDAVVFPKADCRVMLVELFAIRALKRYDSSMKAKKSLGENLTNDRKMDFIAIEAQKYRDRIQVEALIQKIFAAKSSLWVR